MLIVLQFVEDLITPVLVGLLHLHIRMERTPSLRRAPKYLELDYLFLPQEMGLC